ncbi:hypothetical protein, partial [Bacteroides thetaiotaomicron]|uniref:hypothetical protein n=1 Tax=Bacteroides thetaiotaomicron TaxID=818 RepID=UPI001E635E6B
KEIKSIAFFIQYVKEHLILTFYTTSFGGGTPCGKGGDHAHRLSASPKGGREGGRTKIPLYKFIDNSVSIPLPAFIYG